MGKQNKIPSTSEFKGFAAFASHSSTASTAVQLRSRQQQQQQQQQQQPPPSIRRLQSQPSTPLPPSSTPPTTTQPSTTTTPNQRQHTPSPVYTGSDPTLIQTFRRISQKKDAVTKSRALNDLCSYAYPPRTPSPPPPPPSSSSSSDQPPPPPPPIPRSEQLAALSHYLYLFTRKLVHDNHSSVRHLSLQVLFDASHYIPRAFIRTLLSGSATATDASEEKKTCHALGWIFLFRSSRVVDVRSAAERVWGRVVELMEGGGEGLRGRVVSHVEVILGGSSRPGNLADVFSLGSTRLVVGGGGVGGAGVVGGGGKKKKRGKKPPPESTTGGSVGVGSGSTLTEAEKEEMNERYERVVLLTLRGIEQLFRSHPEPPHPNPNNEDSHNLSSYSNLFQTPSLLWKHLSSPRTAFRRATYGVIASLYPNALSILHPPSSSPGHGRRHDLSNLLLNALSSERDPGNYPPLFEMLLLYITSFRNVSGGKVINGDDASAIESAWDTTVKDQDDGDGGGSRTKGMDCNRFVKSMAKIFKKACCGCPADRWGPSVLPIIASLPRGGGGVGGDGQIQLQLLTSLWNGRSVATTSNDTSAIISAVTESASFLLLRRSTKSEIEGVTDAVANAYARLFLDCVSHFLTMSPQAHGGGGAGALARTVGREMYRIDCASSGLAGAGGDSGGNYGLNKCLFGCKSVERWFWNGEDGIRNVLVPNDDEGGNTNLSALGTVLSVITKSIPDDAKNKTDDVVGKGSHLRPILRRTFHRIVGSKRKGNNKGVSEDIDEEASILLLSSILEFCGVEYIFRECPPSNEDGKDNDDTVTDTSSSSSWLSSMETFCMMDLLPCICRHTASSLMTLSSSLYFEILRTVLTTIPSTTERTRLWNNLLVTITSHDEGEEEGNSTLGCDVGQLAHGLTTLIGTDDGVMVDFIRCEALDAFAVRVGDRFMDDFQSQGEVLGQSSVDHTDELVLDHDDDDDNATDSEEEAEEDLILFLRVCLGLTSTIPSSPLIGPEVIVSWYECVSERSESTDRIITSTSPSLTVYHRRNVLLESLLSYYNAAAYPSSNDVSLLSSSFKEKKMELAMVAWKHGGPTWDDNRDLTELLTVKEEEEDKDLCSLSFVKEFISLARDELVSDLRREGDGLEGDHLDHNAYLWSQRAWRLLQITKTPLSRPTSPVKAPSQLPSIVTVGLDDTSLWSSAFLNHPSSNTTTTISSSCDGLYLRLIYLLQNINDKSIRTRMLLGDYNDKTLSTSNRGIIIVSILTTLVNHGPPKISSSYSTPSSSYDSLVARCRYLFDSLLDCSATISSAVLVECCQSAIESLASAMKQYSSTTSNTPNDSALVERGVVVLGYLTTLLCDRRGTPLVQDDTKEEDAIDPTKVKEGDRLWYIMDGNDANSEMVEVSIATIHTDDFPNLYFTVSFMAGNEWGKERTPTLRQTVAGRLRMGPLKVRPESHPPYQPVLATNEEDIDLPACIHRLEEDMVSRLVKPYLGINTECNSGDGSVGVLAVAASEILNVVISKCGLSKVSSGKGAGIGTLRYEVFQLIRSLETECLQVPSQHDGAATPPTSEAATAEGTELEVGTMMKQYSCSLTHLSLALGYGRLTPLSKLDSCAYINFNSGTLMKSLLHFVQRMEEVEEEVNRTVLLSFYRAVLMWITISVNGAMDEDNVADIWSLLDTITDAVDDDNDKHNENASTMWLVESLSAFGSVQAKMTNTPTITDNRGTFIASEQDAFSNLIGMFLRYREDDHHRHQHNSSSDCTTRTIVGLHSIVGSEGDNYNNDNRETKDNVGAVVSLWYAPFRSFVVRNIKADEAALAHAAKVHVEGLCVSLSSTEKRWCAFQILTFLAQKGQELYSEDDEVGSEDSDDDDDILPLETRFRLDDEWKSGLTEQEADELEEDVLATSQWLPHDLMSRIESWKEAGIIPSSPNNNETEHTVTTCLLRWLLCLEFLDAAATNDMRNRSHIGSYIQQTGAVREIIELALEHTTLDDSQQQQQNHDGWSSCTAIDSGLADSLAQIATLTIFRTVESVPTLCKSWWSDFCPRSLQSAVVKFVEGAVAPETLRRELARIQGAGNLDDLVVSGSCVSREVTATYVQDECKLSVLITIPPSFPLRNVQVDCQKTLGISEKRWRHWSLQIMRMLNSQDGSILDALLLWKQNVDKEFEGVEPCPVCYSVLCVKTHSMPNLECKTCNNRFHSSCLYKWFSSSGKNQCVLCQQPWSGTKIA